MSYRREVIGLAGSALGIGFLKTQQKSDELAGPIIVGDVGPALEVIDSYLLDANDEQTTQIEQFAQEPVKIEGVVENSGEESGEETINLSLGSISDGRSVELESGEQTKIFFSPDTPNIEEQTTLTAKIGESKAGEVVVKPRTDIQVVDAFLLDDTATRVSTLSLTEGEMIEAEADIENFGIDSGTIDLVLQMDGVGLDQDSKTVGPDAGTVTSAMSGEAPAVDSTQEYGVSVLDESAGSVEISPAPEIPDSDLLYARFDATKLSLSSGDSVSTWPDESAGRDLTAGTSPTYQTDQINGNDAVVFDASNSEYLDVSWTKISAPYTVFYVGQTSLSDGGFRTPFDAFGQRSSVYIDYRSENKEWILATGSSGSVSGGDSILSTSNHYVTAQFGTANSSTDVSVDVNGNNQLSGNQSVVKALDGLTVGRLHDVTDSRYWDGPIGEILVYDGIPSIADVETYLADKWGAF